MRGAVKFSVRPATWSVTRFGGPVDVRGFRVGSYYVRRLDAAKRIAVALFESDHDLADQILRSTHAPDFCVESVDHKLTAYGIRVLVTGDYQPTPIEPPEPEKVIRYEYDDACRLLRTSMYEAGVLVSQVEHGRAA